MNLVFNFALRMFGYLGHLYAIWIFVLELYIPDLRCYLLYVRWNLWLVG